MNQKQIIKEIKNRIEVAKTVIKENLKSLCKIRFHGERNQVSITKKVIRIYRWQIRLDELEMLLRVIKNK